MRFIIELEGPVFDVSAACFAAHLEAASAVGWSRLDQASFWRLLRTKGERAEFLPGASESKLKEYFERYAAAMENAASFERFRIEEGTPATLATIARHGPVMAISLGTNLEARTSLLKKIHVDRLFRDVRGLSADSRLRPAELKSLSEKDSRAIVVACSDSIVRAADQAELFTVGISTGPCGLDRLQRAGPRIVFKELADLAASLQRQGLDLVKAGLLPAPLGM